MVEAIGEVFPMAEYQCCTVHFYRNAFSIVPNDRLKEIVKMLKAIHAQEDKHAALEKADAIIEKLRGMKLQKVAQKVEDGIGETLTYMGFPVAHWTRIRTNNTLERLNEEIKRRIRGVGTFLDGITYNKFRKLQSNRNQASKSSKDLEVLFCPFFREK